MIVYDSARRPVTLGPELYRGGEGAIFPVQAQPYAGLVAKIYTAAAPNGYDAKLAWMKANPPLDPSLASGHAAIAWPFDLLYTSTGKLAGYVMPHIQNAVPMLLVFNPRSRARTLPDFDWKYLHRAGRNLALALAALHARGYVVGDLNESNILITPAAMVTMIDTDSFQVTAQHSRASAGTAVPASAPITYACPVGKPEYTPPELQGKSFRGLVRRTEQDCFGLGVLIFQLLMEGSHPFRAQWLAEGDPPSIEERIAKGWFPYAKSPSGPVAPPPNAPTLQALHPGLADLILRCFIIGHRDAKLRPTPEEWAHALVQAEKTLVKCPNGHHYSGYLKACPRCGEPAHRSLWPATRPQVAAPSTATNSPAPASVSMPASVSTTAAPAAPAGRLQTTWQNLLSRTASAAPTVTRPSFPSLRLNVGALTAVAQHIAERLDHSTPWLWAGWLLATLIGWIAGALIGGLGRSAIGNPGGDLLEGALIGFSQWLVLRHRIDGVVGWAPLTAIGYAAGAAIDRAFGIGYAPATALLMGSAQAAVLWRRSTQAPWWIAASAGGWLVAFGVTLAMRGTALAFAQPPAAQLAGGAITGAALAWLATLAPRPNMGWLPIRWQLQLISWRATAVLTGLVMLMIAAGSTGLRPCGWLDAPLKLSKCIRTLAQPSPVSGIAFSPDGSTLAAESLDHTIRLWRIGDGALLKMLEARVDGPLAGANPAFAADGANLVSLAGDSVQTWRVADGALLRTQKLGTTPASAPHIAGEYVSMAQLAPAGDLLAQAVCQPPDPPAHAPARCASTAVRIWQVANGQYVASLKGLTNTVQSMAFSFDGNLLALGLCNGFAGGEQTPRCSLGEIQLWHARDGKLVYRIISGADWITSLAFSRDGAKLAAGSPDGGVEVWQVKDGALKDKQQYGAPIRDLAFTSAPLALIVASDSVSIWQLEPYTVTQDATLPGAISNVVVAPNGSILAGLSADNRIILWRLR